MEENETSYKKVMIEPEKKSIGFGKSVLIPFASGIIGASLVVGTCFGVPSIKEKLIINDQKLTNKQKKELIKIAKKKGFYSKGMDKDDILSFLELCL